MCEQQETLYIHARISKNQFQFEACDKRAHQSKHFFSVHVNTTFKFINQNEFSPLKMCACKQIV